MFHEGAHRLECKTSMLHPPPPHTHTPTKDQSAKNLYLAAASNCLRASVSIIASSQFGCFSLTKVLDLSLYASLSPQLVL